MINLVDLIIDICKQFSDNSAIVAFRPENNQFNSITYQQLFEACRNTKQILTECQKHFTTSYKYCCIGIFLDPRESFPAIILGILMCRCPFVCFDINYSKKQINYLLKQLDICLIIADTRDSHLILEKFSRKFTHFKNCKILDDEIEIWSTERTQQKHVVGVESANNLGKGGLCCDKKVLEDEYIYAIQTSGSTGEPKIVKVPERCILPNILHLREVFEITPSDGIYFSSPTTFDPSVVELFLSMTTGAALFIVPTGVKAAAYDVLQLLFGSDKSQRKRSVTFIQTTPSLFLNWPKQFVKENVMNNETCLRVLALGGERCPTSDVIKRYRSEGNMTKIYNLYGITEVSCWASIHLLSGTDDGCDLGHPLSETILQVRGEDGKVVPEGIGEMFIGSSSRYCFLNDEVLDSIKLPIFRATGDTVKVKDNCYYFLGRKDRIIKRWGHRVCLSKIENLALSCVFVKWCSCFIDIKHGLILFFIFDDCVDSKGENNYLYKLRLLLKESLNQASIPDYILPVNQMHLNSHGKVDFSSLRSVVKEKIENVSTSLHESLANKIDFYKYRFGELWRKYTYPQSTSIFREPSDHLGADILSSDGIKSPLFTVGDFHVDSTCDAGFLSAGGNSMSAIQFASELTQFMNVPNTFIGKLLSNSSRSECFKIVMDCNNEVDVNVSVDVCSYNIKKASHSDKYKGKTTFKTKDQCSIFKYHRQSNCNCVKDKSLCDNCIEDSSSELPRLFKKFKSEEDLSFSDRIIVMKCRGKTISFQLNKTNVMECDDNVLVKLIPSNLSIINKINLKSNWRYNLGKCVDASPTVATYESGKALVLVGSHSGHFVVINLQNGRIVSESVLPDRIESSALVSKCGKYFYIGCYDKKLYCLEVNSGRVVWNFMTSDVVKSTPIHGCGSTIIFGSYDKNLYCLCSKTGQEIWHYMGASGFSSVPLLTTCENIIVGSLDGVCTALSCHEGAVLWNYKLEAPIFSSPVVFGSKVLFAEVTGGLYCLDINSGILVWKFNANGNIFSSLTFCENRGDKLVLFGCHDHHVYCLSVNDEPKIIWKVNFESPIFSTPFVSELGGSSIAAICTTKGILYIVDLISGNELSCSVLPNEIFSSPVIATNHVVFGCRDDCVYCLQLD